MNKSRAGSAAAIAILFSVTGVFPQPGSTIPVGPWTDIFNKQDLTGWHHAGNPPWSLSDGILSAQGGSIKTMLIWHQPLKDVEVEVSYRLSTAAANSGIQVRSQCKERTDAFPKCGNYQVCGLQLDVAMNHSGKLFEECVGFLVNSGQNVDDCRRTLKVGEWMTTTARFKGPDVSLWLNGVHCLDYRLTKIDHLTGSIFALQSHPPFDRIDYRSVRIRNLETPSVSAPPAAAPAAGRSLAVAAAMARVRLESAGPWRARLRDARGTLLREAFGAAGSQEVSMPLPGRGLFSLEVTAHGQTSRHRIASVGH